MLSLGTTKGFQHSRLDFIALSWKCCMAFTFTDKAASGIIHDGLPATFPAGAILELRSGSAPGPSAAPTGTLLCSLTLGASPWAAASGRGVSTASALTGTGAAGPANAGYFRLKTSADTGAVTQTQARVEGTITATGGGGDLTLDNVSISSGQSVTITSMTITA